MREFALLREYLVRLRQERLQQAHAATLAATTPADLMHVSNRAFEAEMCSRILVALKDLDEDSGEFTRKYLS